MTEPMERSTAVGGGLYWQQYSVDGGLTWNPPPPKRYDQMDFTNGPRCYCGFPEEIERDHPPSWPSGTPEKEHQRVLSVRAEVAAHPATVNSAAGLRRAVLEMHAPVTSTRGDPYCDGCDSCGLCNPPDWPCSTYKLAMEAE